MTHVDNRAFATRLAITDDVLAFVDYKLCLGVFARLAENELLDKRVEELTQLGSVMSTVYDVSVSLVIKRCLGPELAPEELCWVGRGTAKGSRNVGHIRYDSFDSISFALNFSEENGHAEGVYISSCTIEITQRACSPVAIEFVVDISTDVYDARSSHIGIIAI